MSSACSIPSEVQVLSAVTLKASVLGIIRQLLMLGHPWMARLFASPTLATFKMSFKTFHDLPPRRVITLDPNAGHTAEALREVFLACAWVGWDSEPGHITQLTCGLDAMNWANLAMF